MPGSKSVPLAAFMWLVSGSLTQPVLTQPMLTHSMLTHYVFTQPVLTQPVLTQPVLSICADAIGAIFTYTCVFSVHQSYTYLTYCT